MPVFAASSRRPSAANCCTVLVSFSLSLVAVPRAPSPPLRLAFLSAQSLSPSLQLIRQLKLSFFHNRLLQESRREREETFNIVPSTTGNGLSSRAQRCTRFICERRDFTWPDLQSLPRLLPLLLLLCLLLLLYHFCPKLSSALTFPRSSVFLCLPSLFPLRRQLKLT